MRSVTIIGAIVGIFLGASATSVITTLLNFTSGTAETLSVLGPSAGLLICLVVAAFLIIKIRVISDLINGIIIGIVLSVLVKSIYGADIITLILSQLGF